MSQPLIVTIIAGVALSFTVSACSIDVIPIHYSRLNSAKRAAEPLKRGPDAPGFFTKIWSFSGSSSGYLFDPSKIEIRDGVARVKKPSRERAVIETSRGMPYAALDSFSETAGPSSKGTIRYQLSNDGSRWFYFDGTRWQTGAGNGEQANTASEIQAHISTFHTEAGTGNITVKAFLVSPSGIEAVELKSIQITGIAPATDGWD
jgi:hypothetical protein